MEEAKLLSHFIKKEKTSREFYNFFNDRISKGFDPLKDLDRIGVVNQTTMLASETQQIADYLKQAIEEKSRLNNENSAESFADTRDTLCYATNDNQSAVLSLLSTNADLAIVVGGYNSSNTSHLVELCERKLPTYFIEDSGKMISEESIVPFDLHKNSAMTIKGWLPVKRPIRILLTSGASCPDAIVESVINKLCDFVSGSKHPEQLIEQFL